MGFLRYAKNGLDAALRKVGYTVSPLDEMTALADRWGSDKGTLLDAHGYTRIYQRLFEKWRYADIVLLEIGLFRPDSDLRRRINAAEGSTVLSADRAPSLEMWREFFPRAKLFGFDIDDFSTVKIPGCTIMQGDMSSPDALDALIHAIGEPLDIVIDDASHLSHHQQIALAHLFPHLKSGGIYAIEDLCWQDQELERTEVPKTREVLRVLQVNGAFETPLISAEERAMLEMEVESVRLFDSLATHLEDSTDSLGVLVKK